MRLYQAALIVSLATSAAACGGTGGAPIAAPRPNANSPILVEEIRSSQANDVYTVVQSRRPQWLRRRIAQTMNPADADISVYINGNRVGGLEELRQISAMDTESIAYLSAGQAQARFGTGNLNGAIIVTPARSISR